MHGKNFIVESDSENENIYKCNSLMNEFGL
jgi:hypothetical protein